MKTGDLPHGTGSRFRNSQPTPAEGLMNVDDLFWEDLNAYRLMAERLAEELKVSRELLPQDFTLSQVAGLFILAAPWICPRSCPARFCFMSLAQSVQPEERGIPKRPAPSSQAVLFKGGSLMPFLNARP
jgi:hypothetical protein